MTTVTQMNRRSFTSGLLVLAMVSLAGVAVAGQTSGTAEEPWTMPRTPDGRPDLQGVWANNSATPLERPATFAGKATLTEEEVAALTEAAGRLFGAAGDAAFGDGVFQAALANLEETTSRDGGTGNYSSVWMVERDFDNRTSLITDPEDGKVPAMTPEGQQRPRAVLGRMLQSPSGPEDLIPQVRCITYGLPRVGGIVDAGYNSYYQIFQTSNYVVILAEMIHDVRIIPLGDRPHVRDQIRQWHGDSRGRWEGDTLVVETTNFSPKSNYRGASDNLHLIERFTRVGPQTLHYEITVADPTTWTRQWTARVPLRHTEDAIFEYACHEGNYAMAGILAGARAQEADAGR